MLFNTDYVVASAFLDAESLIPEWSDKGFPIYMELDMDNNDKIVYLGGYEYYADNGGDEVTGINDVTLKKSDLINMIDTTRNISNMSMSSRFSIMQYSTFRLEDIRRTKIMALLHTGFQSSQMEAELKKITSI